MALRTRGYAHRIDIAAAPLGVWHALTDPDLLVRWLGGPAVVKARAGGRYSVMLDPGIEREALIDVFEPGRRLRLVYLTPPQMPAFEGAVVDDYLLEAGGHGTILRLLGSGFPEGRAWEAYYLKIRSASERALARLKPMLERRPAPSTTAAEGS